MSSRSLLPFGWGRSRDLATEGEFEPFRSLSRERERMQREMARVFGDFAPALGPLFGGDGALPRIDVSETGEEWTLAAELPGLDEKEVTVTLADNVLTIKGEKKSERDEICRDYSVTERSYGSFARSVTLPFAADPEQVTASFAKGVLTVTVPKPAEVKDKVRTIPVQGAPAEAGPAEAAPAAAAA